MLRRVGSGEVGLAVIGLVAVVLVPRFTGVAKESADGSNGAG